MRLSATSCFCCNLPASVCFPLSPLLQLWRRDEACRAIFCVLQLALPPVVVILGDDLDDVAHPEADAGLLAGDEFVFGGVIFKLSPHVDLWREAQRLDE